MSDNLETMVKLAKNPKIEKSRHNWKERTESKRADIRVTTRTAMHKARIIFQFGVWQFCFDSYTLGFKFSNDHPAWYIYFTTSLIRFGSPKELYHFLMTYYDCNVQLAGVRGGGMKMRAFSRAKVKLPVTLIKQPS